MLISITIMPITFEILTQPPASAPEIAAPACALTTFILHMETDLNDGAPEQVKEFLQKIASTRGWDNDAFNRLCLVAEETLLTLSQLDADDSAEKRLRLLLVAREDGGAAELEFIAAADTGNIEDRIALPGGRASKNTVEHEISLRLLCHFASSVRHQQYTDADIVTVRVNAAAS